MKRRKSIALFIASVLIATFYITTLEASTEPIPVVTSLEKPSNEIFEGIPVFYQEEVIEFDQAPMVLEGKVMIPLRFVAEALGYKVEWNEETQSVELIQGARYTAVTIGENSYFKNKMAPIELSSKPVIVEGRTMVPAEFIPVILGYGFEVREGQLHILEEEFPEIQGFVHEVKREEELLRISVVSELKEIIEPGEMTILIVGEQTIMNIDSVNTGDWIRGVHYPVMTMSIPAQTGSVVIYQ